MALPVVMEKLHLHLGHVDARRAFALAAFARDAEVQRPVSLVGRERIGTKLARDREAQRVGAAAREMLLVARHSIRRTHRAGVELAAVAVVVAHLDGFIEAAPLA